eukprot:gene30094-35059_t
MESFYSVLFSILAVAVAGLVWSQSTSASIVPKTGTNVTSFVKLRNNYVFVYALMMAGDWLQGPHVYALYQFYGFGMKDIGRLFVAGFGSSMIFGTIVGAMADKHCATKHSSDYWVLMFGRFLGGIATSLLFSAFESWLVAEHFSKGFDEKWLGDTFSKAVFVGNGLVAILAGLVANYLVESLKLGPVAPFDASATVLLLGGAVIMFSWSENYGDTKSNNSLNHQFKLAFAAILSDPKIALLGAMQSLFEAAMYSFVFLWTPALSPNGESIPHGMIFSCFMTASMPILFPTPYFYPMPLPTLSLAPINSQPCRGRRNHCPRSGSARGLLSNITEGGITLHGQVQLVAFCVFEVLVGLFWPSMMTMRAHYLPEDLRSTIINCFRIPLNLFVCVILYNVHMFSLAAMFGLCSVFLVLATICQMSFQKLVNSMPVIKGIPETEPLRSADK